MSDTKVFPNGFKNWRETFYEVVQGITCHINFISGFEENESVNDIVYETKDQFGTTGLYDLAELWTDEFELINKGREWNGEFLDEIEAFVNKKINRE